jgi:hypothetical protein
MPDAGHRGLADGPNGDLMGTNCAVCRDAIAAAPAGQLASRCDASGQALQICYSWGA